MAKSFCQKYFGFILSGVLILGLVALYFLDSQFQAKAKEVWRVLMSEDKALIEDYVKKFGIWSPQP